MEVVIRNNGLQTPADIFFDGETLVVSPKEKFTPKDGDVVTSVYKGKYQGVLIFRDSEDGEVKYYCGVNLYNEFYKGQGYFGYVEYLRPSTEEEKHMLFERIDQEGLVWNAENKNLVEKKWKPKEGDCLFMPFSDSLSFKPAKCAWLGTDLDIRI